MEVMAVSEEEARQWAFDHWQSFPWDGADYERPEGAAVDAADVEAL